MNDMTNRKLWFYGSFIAAPIIILCCIWSVLIGSALSTERPPAETSHQVEVELTTQVEMTTTDDLPPSTSLTTEDTTTAPEEITTPVLEMAPPIPPEATTSPETQIVDPYSSIPISNSLKQFVLDECDRYSLDPKYVFAIMAVETTYGTFLEDKETVALDRYEVLGDGGNAYGIMQIWPSQWSEGPYKEIADSLGVTDFCDNFQNTKLGIYILNLNRDWFLRNYPQGFWTEETLMMAATMAHNMGAGEVAKVIRESGVEGLRERYYWKMILEELEIIG